MSASFVKSTDVHQEYSDFYLGRSWFWIQHRCNQAFLKPFFRSSRLS